MVGVLGDFERFEPLTLRLLLLGRDCIRHFCEDLIDDLTRAAAEFVVVHASSCLNCEGLATLLLEVLSLPLVASFDLFLIHKDRTVLYELWTVWCVRNRIKILELDPVQHHDEAILGHIPADEQPSEA